MLSINPEQPAPGKLSMADLAPMQTVRTIVGIESDGKEVTLQWDDGCRSHFHALWLRDNCACPECRHPQALERTFMFVDHAAPSITTAGLGPDEALEVRFRTDEGSHVSRYTKGWLRAYDCSESESRAWHIPRQLWGAEIARRLPSVDYEDYMQTNAGLRLWLEALRAHGIVILRGVPQQPGKLLEIAHRIGPVRTSNFGAYYDVVSMPNPNASAYTPMGLELHTDLANWPSPPDVQLLFCLKNSVSGGESVFADGFSVAENLRVRDPKAFQRLSTQPLDFRFHDESCDIRARAPAIEVDREGRLVRIRFNNWLRAPLIAAKDEVLPVYEALGTLWRMLRDPRYRLNLRLAAGDLIAYDNSRVLHGRAPFDARSGERHLQGCYLNQADIESRLRLLDRLQV